jgi:hypothetical protein
MSEGCITVNLTFEGSNAVSTGLLHGLGSDCVSFHVVEHLLF